LVGAGAVSLSGNALTRVAVSWFVLSTGRSAAQVGLTLFFETLPLFLGSFFGEVLVDGLGHKRSSVVADLASGATLAVVPLLHALGALPFGLLLGLVFVGAFLDAPGAAARQALLPEAAEEAGLERANAAYQTIRSLADLVGPVVGGARRRRRGDGRVTRRRRHLRLLGGSDRGARRGVRGRGAGGALRPGTAGDGAPVEPLARVAGG
jgi:MFS family permease